MTREEAIEELEKLKRYVEPRFYRDGYLLALDMAIEALSAEAVRGVGRYENAMQKLRDMPRYLNGVKVKQIKKIPSEAVLGEWKPISDGTPQRVGSYLVTCKGEHGFIYVDYDFWTVSDEFKYHNDNVIAWMTFLKPYKGGDTE